MIYLRWRECHCCESEEETVRVDKTIVRIYECHCCWREYCDTCGYIDVRICDECLDEAYINNYEYPYVVSNDDPMGIESAPEWIKEQAKIIEKEGLFCFD